MSRRAATFTQADMARALRAAEQVAPGRLRVRVTRDGEIIVEHGAPVGKDKEAEKEAPVAPEREIVL